MNKKPRPEYEALVDRIAAGEITRLQASQMAQEQTGLSASNFLAWVGAHHKDRLKDVRGNTGAKNIHFQPEKQDAYKEALDLAISGKVSIRAAAQMKGVSYPYLLKKMRAAGATVARKDQVDEQLAKLSQALAKDPTKVLALARALQELTA